MIVKAKLITVLITLFLITACTKNKAVLIQKTETMPAVTIPNQKNEETIEGIYTSNECDLSVKITKTKDGYTYFLKTSERKLNGKATFSKSESGEKYLVLEGIKWDEYEGDISNEEESDSISDSGKPAKEIEIPIGIDASYTKDTLTIQNYGNAMNSYTKISECGSKYIQLIRKR